MAIVSGVNEEMIVSHLIAKFEDLKNARKAKEDVWTECTRMYLSQHSSEAEKWMKENSRSHRYLSASWDAVETVKAQILAQMFPGNNWLKLTPGEPGGWQDDDIAAKHLMALIHDQTKKTRFKNQWAGGVLQMLITGSTPFTTGWDTQYTVDYPSYASSMAEYDQQNQYEWQVYQQQIQQWQQQARAEVAAGANPQDIGPQPQFRVPGPPVADPRIAYEGPTIEFDDLYNFVQDPFPNRKDGALRIKKTWKTRAYLERFGQPDENGYRVYENLNRVTDVDLQSSKTMTDSHMIERMLAFNMQIPNMSKGVELMEAQGDMEIPLQVSGHHVFMNYTATIANNNTLVRFEPGFLWIGEPATQLAAISVPPGEIYGVGILEMARGTQDLLNVRVNQLVDVVAAVINPEYKCYWDGVIDLNAKSRPGKRHLVANMKNLEPLIKDMRGAQIGMQDLATLKGEFQSLTRSANPSVASYQKSATEIQRDAGISSSTMTQMVREIEDLGLTKSVEHFVCMNAMFIDNVTMAHTTQDGKASWLPVSPEQIRRHWLVEVMGSQHVAERAQRLQDMMFFANMTWGNPITAPFIKHLNLLKKIYSEMGFRDGEDMFVDEQTGDQLLTFMVQNGLLLGGQQPGGNLGANSGAGAPAADGAQGQGPGIAGDQAGDAGGGISDALGLLSGGLPPALQGLTAGGTN